MPLATERTQELSLIINGQLMAIRVQKKEKHYEAINVYRSRPAIGSVREARPRQRECFKY